MRVWRDASMATCEPGFEGHLSWTEVECIKNNARFDYEEQKQEKGDIAEYCIQYLAVLPHAVSEAKRLCCAVPVVRELRQTRSCLRDCSR